MNFSIILFKQFHKCCFGLFQLTNDRRADFFNYAMESGRPWNSFDTQILFFIKELYTYKKMVLPEEMNKYEEMGGVKESNLEAATKKFMNEFEIPNPDPDVNHIDERQDKAKDVFDNYQ